MNRLDFSMSTFVAVALLTATSAHAANVFSASGSCGKGVGGLLDNDPSLDVSCPGGTWVDPSTGTASSASWTASGGNGRFRAGATVAVSTLPPLGRSTPLALGVSVSAVASQRDDLLFNVPGLAGTPAKMAFSLWIHGEMDAANVSPAGNTASRADWIFRASTVSNRRSLGSAAAGSGVTNFYDWGFTGDPDVAALYGFELPVVLGQIVTLDLSLEAKASASGWRAGLPGSALYLTPVQSTAVASFGNTALWQGITSLTLNDGTPVQNWTLSSSSGFDYTSPVPESGTWALMAGGLALLTALSRRTRSATPRTAT